MVYSLRRGDNTVWLGAYRRVRVAALSTESFDALTQVAPAFGAIGDN